MADANQLARPAVERLSEDESLRGELSDIGFGPLLDWAVAAVKAYAAKAADSAAMDAFTDRVRGVVQAVVEAAQDGTLTDPTALLDFDPANPDKAAIALKDLQLGGDPDDNAARIAAVLQTALAGDGETAAPPVTLTLSEPVPAETEKPTEAASPEIEKPTETIPVETPKPAEAVSTETGVSANEAAEVKPPAGEAATGVEPTPDEAGAAVSSALEAASKLANSILGTVNPTPVEVPAQPQTEPAHEPTPTPAPTAPASGPTAPAPDTPADGLKSRVSQVSNSARSLSRGKRRRRKR